MLRKNNLFCCHGIWEIINASLWDKHLTMSWKRPCHPKRASLDLVILDNYCQVSNLHLGWGEWLLREWWQTNLHYLWIIWTLFSEDAVWVCDWDKHWSLSWMTCDGRWMGVVSSLGTFSCLRILLNHLLSDHQIKKTNLQERKLERCEWRVGERNRMQ